MYQNSLPRKVFGAKIEEVTESRENFIVKSFKILTPKHTTFEQQNELGRACGTYGREDWCIQVLVGKPQTKRALEDLVTDVG